MYLEIERENKRERERRKYIFLPKSLLITSIPLIERGIMRIIPIKIMTFFMTAKQTFEYLEFFDTFRQNIY